MRDDGPGRSSSPQRRRGRCTVALAAAALALSLLSVELSAAMLAAGPAPPGAAASTVTLTDDDWGSAMFHADDLVPGRPVTRCIAVSYAGGDAAEVRLFADAAGDLRKHLNLVVEAGSGGGFRDCTGFRGTVVYDGTLARFATAHGAGETSLPTLAASGRRGSRTFRFTLEPRSVAEA